MSGILLNLDSSQRSNGEPEDFTVYYQNVSLDPESEYEIALLRFECWYSWPNIDASIYGNATWRYNDGTTWSGQLTIPTGMYSISDLETYIQETITSLGDNGSNISLTPNYSTLKLQIGIANNYALDLSIGRLCSLLGFESQIISTTSVSESTVDITNGITAIHLHCSLVGGSYHMESASDIIHTFTPLSPPGTLLSIEPYTPVYLPLSEVGAINQMRVRVSDQNNNTLSLRGEHCSYTLHVRKVA